MPTVIVGAGNAFRRDDGAGLAAASRLRAAVSGDIRVLAKEGGLVTLLDEWDGADAVVVFGIEGRDFTPGEGLSPDVDVAVDAVVRRVSEEAMRGV